MNGSQGIWKLLNTIQKLWSSFERDLRQPGTTRRQLLRRPIVAGEVQWRTVPQYYSLFTKVQKPCHGIEDWCFAAPKRLLHNQLDKSVAVFLRHQADGYVSQNERDR
jgi:hypothetical protein